MNLLDNIVATISDGIGKHDDIPFQEKLRFSVKYWRAFLIRRDFERNNVDPTVYQTLCIDLELTDLSVCCNVPIGCKGLKTVLPIPRVVHVKRSAPFSLVAYPKNHRTIGYLSKEYWENCKDFGKDEPVYDLLNRHVIINNETKLRKLLVKDIWFDPEELPKCSSAGSVCYDEDTFHTPSHMIDTIINGIMSQELQIINPNDRDVEINKQDN